MGISTHILDTSIGRPAANVPVSLSRRVAHDWINLSAPNLRTDADGRARELLPLTTPLDPGLYRVRFETAEYYKSQQLTGLYPWVEITF
jgi:5-hydroxyisourate hydrolase